MRVTVFGAGAVGGHLAAKLCAVPRAAVSIVTRGPHLEAARRDGMRLISGDGEWHGHPVATDDPASLPEQDLVFVTLKAPSIHEAAPAIGRLLAPAGTAVFLSNGMPWWMECRAGSGGPAAEIMGAIGAERFLAGIVYSSNHVEQPGLVRHASHDLWQVGEPAGGLSQRAGEVAGLLRTAGMTGVAHADIAQAIWSKLVLNASANPFAALTRLTTVALAHDDAVAGLMLAVRREIDALAAAQGYDHAKSPFLRSLDDLKLAPDVQPSMLQDVLAGRALEVDAMVDAPRRAAAACGVATPTLDVISPLLNGLDRALALIRQRGVPAVR